MLMSKFKVGQRVHNNKEGYFCKIDNIGDDNTTWVMHDDGVDALVLVKDLHETADDMFERLGYMKYNDCINDELFGYQWQDKETFKDHKIRNIFFYKDKTWNVFQDHICKAIVFDRPTIAEHLAIHQKMIELGWL
jgi:hypothetical protein